MNIYGGSTEGGLANGGTITGDLNVTGDVCIDPDLKVTGHIVCNTLEANTIISDLEVKDSLVHIAYENPADDINMGVFGEYESSGKKYAGLLRNRTDKSFYLSNNDATLPTASGTIYNRQGALKLGALDCTSATVNNYALPTADGTVNQVIQTDGAGVLSFADASGGDTFDQPLNTTDAVEFKGLTVTDIDQAIVHVSSTNVTRSDQTAKIHLNSDAARACGLTVTNVGFDSDSSDWRLGRPFISADAKHRFDLSYESTGADSNRTNFISADSDAGKVDILGVEISDTNGLTLNSARLNIKKTTPAGGSIRFQNSIGETDMAILPATGSDRSLIFERVVSGVPSEIMTFGDTSDVTIYEKVIIENDLEIEQKFSDVGLSLDSGAGNVNFLMDGIEKNILFYGGGVLKHKIQSVGDVLAISNLTNTLLSIDTATVSVSDNIILSTDDFQIRNTTSNFSLRLSAGNILKIRAPGNDVVVDFGADEVVSKKPLATNRFISCGRTSLGYDCPVRATIYRGFGDTTTGNTILTSIINHPTNIGGKIITPDTLKLGSCINIKMAGHMDNNNRSMRCQITIGGSVAVDLNILNPNDTAGRVGWKMDFQLLVSNYNDVSKGYEITRTGNIQFGINTANDNTIEGYEYYELLPASGFDNGVNSSISVSWAWPNGAGATFVNQSTVIEIESLAI